MKKTDNNAGKKRQIYVAGVTETSSKKPFVLIVIIIALGIAFLKYGKPPENPSEPLTEVALTDPAISQDELLAIPIEEVYEKALEFDNKRSSQINNEGLALMKAKKFDKAIEKFSEAMVLAPSEEIIKDNLANAYVAYGGDFLRAKDYEAAIQHFALSIDVKPSAAAHKGRGIALLETGERTDAMADIEESILLNKDDSNAHILMGSLLYEVNRLEDAGEHFESALEIDPANIRATNFLKKIKREAVEDSFDGKESSNFYVKYEGLENAETGHLLLMVLEEAYYKVGADIGLYPERPVTVILYTNRQFSDVTRSPAWAGGLYDGKIRLPSGGISQKTDKLIRVAYHEYTHALVHQATGGNCPVWLNEGLAQLEEGADISRAKNFLERTGGPIPLRQLEGSFMQFDASTASKAYATSLLAVDYIVSEYSLAYIKSILELLGKGESISEAIRSTLYLSYDDIEKSFIDSL